MTPWTVTITTANGATTARYTTRQAESTIARARRRGYDVTVHPSGTVETRRIGVAIVTLTPDLTMARKPTAAQWRALEWLRASSGRILHTPPGPRLRIAVSDVSTSATRALIARGWALLPVVDGGPVTISATGERALTAHLDAVADAAAFRVEAPGHRTQTYMTAGTGKRVMRPYKRFFRGWYDPTSYALAECECGWKEPGEDIADARRRAREHRIAMRDLVSTSDRNL